VIVLDTNVLSELLRSEPERRVIEWIETQPDTSLFTTTVTQGEILLGIAVLPSGRRRSALALSGSRDLRGRSGRARPAVRR
jgi:predicted nucleic acid-binding protein